MVMAGHGWYVAVRRADWMAGLAGGILYEYEARLFPEPAVDNMATRGVEFYSPDPTLLMVVPSLVVV
jgi:hypothetical protein